LAMKIEKIEALLLASNLEDIYIHYIFESKYSRLQGNLQTWPLFTNKITRLQEKIHHEQLTRTLKQGSSMNDGEVEAELAKEKNIRILRSPTRDRATVVNSRRKTVDEQHQRLFEKARRMYILPDFGYKKSFFFIV
jgi:hypothetical protein